MNGIGSCYTDGKVKRRCSEWDYLRNGGRNREEELLANCYFNSMKLARDNGIRSIAFPSISTGAYSFPVVLAAKIAVRTVARFLHENPDSFDLVEWVLFDTQTESVYEAEVTLYYNIRI